MQEFKFRPQPQPAVRIVRPRLLRLLREAVEPFVVVSGPAGAGKTTLVAEWARKSWQRHDCAWLNLDSRDNDPAVLRTGITRALRNTNSPRHDRTTLVVDRCEALTAADAVEYMAEFLIHRPPGLRVVMATRNVPSGPVPALRARAGVAEIRPADLAFTPQEARELFAAAGVPLTPKRCADVYDRTEGWAAGLGITAHDLVRDEQGFPRAEQHIADYLKAEVLHRLTAERRDFLERVSVLDELSPDSCAAVTGIRRAGALLQDIAEQVQFLVPTGPGRTAFRIHPALRTALRTASSQVPATERPRASLPRLRTAHETAPGGDLAAVTSEILCTWERAVATGRHAEVTGRLAGLPRDHVAAHRELSLAGAMARLAAGDVQSAGDWLDLADSPRAGAGGTSTSYTGTGTGTGTGTEGRTVARSVLHYLRGEIGAAFRLVDPGWLTSPDAVGGWRALGCVTRGLALMWQGEFDESRHWLHEAATDARAADHRLALVRALGSQAACAGLSGDAEQARSLGDRALAAAEDAGLGDHFGVALAHVGRGGAFLSAHALDDADRSLAAAGRVLATSVWADEEPHVRALWHLLTSRLATRRGDRPAAHAALQRASLCAARCKSPGILGTLLPSTPEELSDAERRILRALCGPLTLREIAAELYVSHNTVKTQVSAVFRKLDAHSRPDAVAKARERGLL